MLDKTTLPIAIFVLLSGFSIAQAESVNTQHHTAASAGYWVDLSGRGVLEINDDTATFSVAGETNPQHSYQIEQSGQQLVLNPVASNVSGKPITATLDEKNHILQLQKDKHRYQFVPAPDITAASLSGYWRTENMKHGQKNIRALHYKNDGEVYDYYWWRVNRGHGTYQTHIDKNVPLQIKHGFIFTAPGANNDFLVYATGQDDDKIHYVDSTGTKWSESKTDSLYQFTPPEGFKELKGR